MFAHNFSCIGTLVFCECLYFSEIDWYNLINKILHATPSFFSETFKLGPFPVCWKRKMFQHLNAATATCCRRGSPAGGPGQTDPDLLITQQSVQKHRLSLWHRPRRQHWWQTWPQPPAGKGSHRFCRFLSLLCLSSGTDCKRHELHKLGILLCDTISAFFILFVVICLLLLVICFFKNEHWENVHFYFHLLS